MKIHNLAISILVMTATLLAVSCKKTPDPTPVPGQETDDEQVFWGIVGQLSNPDNYTSDYLDKTFEPTLGEAVEGSYDRVVETNDQASAALRFANLVGLENFDPQTATYTFSHPAVGTLTYTKSKDESSLASVKVSIKQMPHLTNIIYKTAQQMGYNAPAFRGTAYYRFGDVISRTLPEGKTELYPILKLEKKVKQLRSQKMYFSDN